MVAYSTTTDYGSNKNKGDSVCYDAMDGQVAAILASGFSLYRLIFGTDIIVSFLQHKSFYILDYCFMAHVSQSGYG